MRFYEVDWKVNEAIIAWNIKFHHIITQHGKDWIRKSKKGRRAVKVYGRHKRDDSIIRVWIMKWKGQKSRDRHGRRGKQKKNPHEAEKWGKNLISSVCMNIRKLSLHYNFSDVSIRHAISNAPLFVAMHSRDSGWQCDEVNNIIAYYCTSQVTCSLCYMPCSACCRSFYDSSFYSTFLPSTTPHHLIHRDDSLSNMLIQNSKYLLINSCSFSWLVSSWLDSMKKVSSFSEQASELQHPTHIDREIYRKFTFPN